MADAAYAIDAAPGTPDAAPGALDASTPDAMVTPDAAPGTPDASMPDAMTTVDGACVPQWVELLTNSNFDAGATDWTATTNNAAIQVIRMFGAGYPWTPHSNDWAALFGGFNTAAQTLTQQFTVPADATMLRFRTYQCFVTEESSVDNEWDTVDIELQTTAGSLLESLAHLSNLDAGTSCGWSVVERAAGSSYAGQTIQIDFDVTTDESSITSFGFDTLAVEAFACP